MKHSQTFLICTFSTLCAGCAAAALSLTPVNENRNGTAAGFAFFAAMSAANLALLGAAVADARAQLS